MANPYLSELRIFTFAFAPKGWALCNGQLMPINQNQALFALLGTTYGGNGIQTFGLPNLQGRVPMHLSSTFPEGAIVGEATHTLLSNEMPQHTHPLQGTSTAASVADPAGGLMATAADQIYTDTPGLTVTLAPATITSTGGGQPHQNEQPYLVVNVCIALVGIFPSRN
ncbi:MAG: phage tail protein [Solirubrobacteraceae bacterium]